MRQPAQQNTAYVTLRGFADLGPFTISYLSVGILGSGLGLLCPPSRKSSLLLFYGPLSTLLFLPLVKSTRWLGTNTLISVTHALKASNSQ